MVNSWTQSMALASGILQFGLEAGISLNEIKQRMQNNCKDANQLYRVRKVIDEVYDKSFKDIDIAKYSENVKSLFDALGIGETDSEKE